MFFSDLIVYFRLQGSTLSTIWLVSLVAASEMASPVIYTPMTRAQLGWFTHQNKKCGELEMDYYRCASRVGQVRAMVDCIKEYEDFNECVYHNKQFARYCAMQEERKKQGRPFKPVPHPDVANAI